MPARDWFRACLPSSLPASFAGTPPPPSQVGHFGEPGVERCPSLRQSHQKEKVLQVTPTWPSRKLVLNHHLHLGEARVQILNTAFLPLGWLAGSSQWEMVVFLLYLNLFNNVSNCSALAKPEGETRKNRGRACFLVGLRTVGVTSQSKQSKNELGSNSKARGLPGSPVGGRPAKLQSARRTHASHFRFHYWKIKVRPLCPL